MTRERFCLLGEWNLKHKRSHEIEWPVVDYCNSCGARMTNAVCPLANVHDAVSTKIEVHGLGTPVIPGLPRGS